MSLDYGMSSDPFSHWFSNDERIMKIMMLDDAPRDDHHHHFSLPNSFKDNLSELYQPNIIELSINYALIYHVYYENNLLNIEETFHIDISIKTKIFENLHIDVSCSPNEVNTYKALFQELRDVFSWSYEENPSTISNIVVHEIKMYLDAKLVQKSIHPLHPKKVVAIKVEVEKILPVGSIYLVPLTNSGCLTLFLSWRNR